MKKMGIIFILMFIFFGCGKDPVELKTSEEKKLLVDQVIAGDKDAIKELEEIKVKLEKQANNGQMEAKNEIEEWNSIEQWQKNLGSDFEKPKWN